MNRVLKAILATLFVATATFSPVVAIAKDRQSERHITEISSGQTVPLIIRNSSEGGTDSGGGDPKFMWKQTLQLSSDAVFSEEVLAQLDA